MKLSTLQNIVYRCIEESITDKMDDMNHDYLQILEQVSEEFHSGQKRQTWKLIPARDIKLVWAKFAKYGRVDEKMLEKIWDMLKTSTIKIIINSDITDGSDPSFFYKEEYDEITKDDWKRWSEFISDQSGADYGRHSLEWGTGGHMRHSDAAKSLYRMLEKSYHSTSSDELLYSVDKILNFIHGIGHMAKWFVEGGATTLDAIRDYQAKGIHNLGTIGESFLNSFQSNIRGTEDYVEVFVNPTDREIKECMSHDQYGLILSGKNAYVWNRMGAYHYRVRNFLGNSVGKDYVSILVYVVRDREVEVMISDDTKRSSWHHNPKVDDYIKSHPFFRNKQIVNILYWDEDVVGDWKKLIKENTEKHFVGNYLYHVTPAKNIPNMKINGILPKPDKPAKFCSKAVYFFDNRTSLEDALMNWLSDKFDENEKLVILTINPSGLNIHSSGVGYEVYSCETIPWKNVIKIEKV